MHKSARKGFFCVSNLSVGIKSECGALLHGWRLPVSIRSGSVRERISVYRSAQLTLALREAGECCWSFEVYSARLDIDKLFRVRSSIACEPFGSIRI